MKTHILKIAKWFFGILLGIFLLISGAIYLFKDEIIGYVINSVNTYLKAEVNVNKVDLTFWSTFPRISVDFEQVFVKDAVEGATSKDTLLYTELIRLKFNPLDVWKEDYKVRKIEIHPGTLQLKVDKDGNVNYNLFRESKDTVQSSFRLNLEDVFLDGVRFAYSNAATSQLYAASIREMSLKGDFTEKEFTVQAAAAIFVNEAKSGEVRLIRDKNASFDLGVQVNTSTGEFRIPEALVYVENLPFSLAGYVTPDFLHFDVHAKNIQLQDVANHFSVDQVSEVKHFKGKGNVYFDLLAEGKIQKTKPVDVICKFGVKNGSLTEPVKGTRVNAVQLDGIYSNKGGNEQEFLNLSGVRFVTSGGPFSGNLKITHFAAPELKGNAKGTIDLDVLQALFQLPYVESMAGKLAVESDFDVKMLHRESGGKDYDIRKLNGEVDLIKAEVKLLNDKRNFRNMNGTLFLKNDEAGLRDVMLHVDETDLQLDGIFSNLKQFLAGDGNLNAQVGIRSDRLDVQDLGTTTKEEKLEESRHYILPDRVRANVQLSIGKLIYGTHTFEAINGTMRVGDRLLEFPSISLVNASAPITGNLTIEERSPEIFYLKTFISSDNIQFKPLFREWDNFHQEVITEKNISGRATAKVKFEAPFDFRSGILSSAIRSEVYVKISDGRLKNVDAFKSITESMKTSSAARLIIGKENIAGLEKKLLDLQFQTLENTFTIENSRIVIPEMTIRSNALDVDVEGSHAFDNRIDYRFAFRFRDLKTKNSGSEFGTEVDDGTGLHVFVKMTGTIDDPVIVWDNEARKEEAKAARQQDAQDIKSMLKTELGLFRKDSTVNSSYQKKNAGPKEVISIDNGEAEPVQDGKSKKKKSSLTEKWKQEKEKEKQETFEVE